MTATTATAAASHRIKCELCGAEIHAVQLHLKQDHPETTIDMYKAAYPDAPLLSELAKMKVAEAQKAKGADAATPAPASIAMAVAADGTIRRALHEVFGFGKIKAALNSKGEPIPVTCLTECAHPELVPDENDGYVYEMEDLKNALLAIELNIPTYCWGHAGTGKTEFFEQIAARTKRPTIRVQHTVNTEESHVIGMWTVRDGQTVFQLGPLAMAMKHGWTYLADEYDFALPSVLSVYQPVLEGKALVIKEADDANRIIRPHKNFRFLATGNTNGSGDETGLYQGTSIQNAANYDRFGMVIHKKYMKPDMEAKILINRAGIDGDDAKKLVDFANRVRESYDGSKISNTISPRTLINAAKLGLRRGSYRAGISLSFANKLSRVDAEVVDGLSQRIFG
jgi:cobaltochelatase CobS